MEIKHSMTKFLILLTILFILNLSCVQAFNTNLISFKDHIKSFERKTLAKSLNTEKDPDTGKIRIVMRLDNTPIPEGIEVEAKSGNLVQALISADKLRELEKSVYIREPLRVFPQTVSQGVGVINASSLHNLNITGEGVKVAVIDVGFTDVNSNPEIWNVEEIKSFRSDGLVEVDKHGTACAEIILDVAPNASLYLYTVQYDVELLEAINYSIEKGVDIISMSLGLLNAGGYDGTGEVCEKVNEAHDAGIFFVVAAGNFAQYHYEGNFTDNDSNDFHEFSGTDEVLNIENIGTGMDIGVYLSWYDWPTSDQDYDMCLVKWNNSTGDWDLVTCSEGTQTGTQEPVEYIGYTVQSSGDYGVIIYNYSANESVHFDLFVLSSPNVYPEYNNPEGSISIPADARGAFAVGATYWADDSLETFSSRGPTNDGRIKPDVVAPDGVSSYTYGSFYGTSAATPHVAGAAALLLSYDYSLSPDELKDYLEKTAVDLGGSGKDNQFGAGRIDVYNAYQHTRIKYINNSTFIQETINLAKNGDVIILRDGIYSENVIVNKSVTIRSENGSASCTINASNHILPVFTVNASYVNISGITITEGDAGILVNGSNCNFSYNSITDNNYGIKLNNSNNNIISSNIFSSNQWDIYASNSSNDTFLNNTLGRAYPTTIDFTHSGGIALKGVDSPPATPDRVFSTGKYVNITNLTQNAWLRLNISYSDEIAGDEFTIKIWKYNGIWQESGWNGSRYLDMVNNTVGVNIIDFSIFSAFTRDVTPPLSVSNLQNTTGNFWINWSWSNPESDFNHTMVFIDGVFQLNTSLSYYNATFLPHGNHTISTRTVDSAGNINTTWVNQTTEIPNNPPVLTNLSNLTVFENETVFIELNATDADGDNITYFCNRTDLFTDFSATTGKGNWTTQTGNAGVHYVDFGVSDGYNGTDNITMSITVYDSSPPQSIKDLQAKTGTSSINWMWVNPSNFDFSHVMVYLNGVWVANVTTNYYEATNLNPGTEYEIGTRTVDESGLINETWVNMSVKTESTQPTRVIRSGGGGGGGSISIIPPRMEATSEVTHSEIRYFKSGKEVTLTLPPRMVELTNLTEIKVISEGSATLTVTVGYVKEFKEIPDRYSVISMFEVVVSKYGIKVENGIKGTLKFRISKEILEYGKPVLIKFNTKSGEWVEVQSEKESEDDRYLHYTSNLTSFSVFAIAEVAEVRMPTISMTKKPPERTSFPEKIMPVETQSPVPEPSKEKIVETPLIKSNKLGKYDWSLFILGIILASILRQYIRKNQ